MVKVSKYQMKSKTCEKTSNKEYVVQGSKRLVMNPIRPVRKVLGEDPNMGKQAAEVACASKNKGTAARHAAHMRFTASRIGSQHRDAELS